MKSKDGERLYDDWYYQRAFIKIQTSYMDVTEKPEAINAVTQF